MNARLSALLVVTAVLSPGAACTNDDGSGDICTAEALAAALAAAAPGDTVRIGACRIAGSFTVPAGVALVGAGPDRSIVETAAPQPALRLSGGDPATRVADLAVQSAGNTGLLARGGGAVALERLVVRATRHVAVGLEGLASATLSDVELQGTVNADNANGIFPVGTPPAIDAEAWPTYGLVAVDIPNLALAGVWASGFAGMGVLLVNDTATWNGGGAPANLGTGLMVYGGSATLADLDLSRTLGGVLLTPAYGAVFSGDADVRTERLQVSDGDGLGLLHDDVTARHVDLVARNNGDAAVWLQFCDGVELTGAGMELAANRFGGVVAVSSSNLTVADGRIDDTVLATRIFGETGSVLVGDGIQVVRPSGPVTVRDLALSGNARVGLLVELGGGGIDEVSLTRVVVDGSGTQLGALAQGGTVAAGWDDGVERRGATVENDLSPPARLDIVGTVSDGDLPSGASAVASEGLIAIGDPDPPG